MATKAQPEKRLTGVLTARWDQVSRKVIELAETFPEKELESRPLAAIRTFGEVLRHIAFWNLYVTDSLHGKETDGTNNELSVTTCPTKASILKKLKQSAADVVTELRKHGDSLDVKTEELIVTFLEHTSEHYGQLVVYARLIGVVPPTSRL